MGISMSRSGQRHSPGLVLDDSASDGFDGFSGISVACLLTFNQIQTSQGQINDIRM